MAAVVVIAAEEYLAGILRAGVAIGHHHDRFLFAEIHSPLLRFALKNSESCGGKCRRNRQGYI